jgi:hypothetical protein
MKLTGPISTYFTEQGYQKVLKFFITLSPNVKTCWGIPSPLKKSKKRFNPTFAFAHELLLGCEFKPDPYLFMRLQNAYIGFKFKES